MTVPVVGTVDRDVAVQAFQKLGDTFERFGDGPYERARAWACFGTLRKTRCFSVSLYMAFQVAGRCAGA